MAERAKTKDEKFMICLYQEVLKQSDSEAPVDRYQIGVLAGLQQRAVDAICHLLVQANFIKKHGKTDDIVITPHGIKLAQSLLAE